jgi:flagellar hook-associated protein 2
MISPVSLRGITSLDMYNRVPPITPYAHYPHEEQSKERPASGSDVWTRPLKSAADSAAQWLIVSRAAAAAVDELLEPQSSAWQRRTVTSSDSDAVTGVAVRGAAVTSYTIDASALAYGQLNQGYDLAPGAFSVVEAGRHTFTVSAGGRTVDVSVDIGSSDNNLAALRIIRDAVNGTGLSVKAALKEDNTSAAIRLELASAASGTNGNFAVADLQGSAIRATGTGAVKETAADAIYTVNGHQPISSQSNSISLDGDKVTLELKATTALPVTVDIGVDTGAVIEQTAAVVEAVNRLYGMLEDDDDSAYLNPLLLKNLEQAMSSGSMRRYGLTRPTSEEWLLDERKLHTSIADHTEAVEQELTGFNGWIGSLSKTLDFFNQLPIQALLNPDAQIMQVYTTYGSTMLPDWQLPANGWYMNTTA